MDISVKERISLINQYEILKRLDSNNTKYYKELIEILYSGYSIFYNKIEENINDEMPEKDGKFVLDILSIYRIVEDYKEKNPNDTDIVEHAWSTFKGFDGNEEASYLGFTMFLFNIQGKFTEQLKYCDQTDDFNSHMPLLDKYRKMINTWQDFGKKYDISKDKIIQILDA